MGILVQTLDVSKISARDYVQATLERHKLLWPFNTFRAFWPHLPSLIEGGVQFASHVLPDPDHPESLVLDACFLRAGQVFEGANECGHSRELLRAGMAEFLRPLLQVGCWNVRLDGGAWRPEDGQNLLPALATMAQVEIELRSPEDRVSPIEICRGIEKAMYRSYHARDLGASLEELLGQT